MPFIFSAAPRWHRGSAARADEQRTGICASCIAAAAIECAAGNGKAMPFKGGISAHPGVSS